MANESNSRIALLPANALSFSPNGSIKGTLYPLFCTSSWTELLSEGAVATGKPFPTHLSDIILRRFQHQPWHRLHCHPTEAWESKNDQFIAFFVSTHFAYPPWLPGSSLIDLNLNHCLFLVYIRLPSAARTLTHNMDNRKRGLAGVPVYKVSGLS